MRKHDRGEVGPLDLGLGELRAVEESGLVVEPDRDAGTEAAASAGSLVGRGLGDVLDREPLDLGPAVEPGDSGRPGVDHRVDAQAP